MDQILKQIEPFTKQDLRKVAQACNVADVLLENNQTTDIKMAVLDYYSAVVDRADDKIKRLESMEKALSEMRSSVVLINNKISTEINKLIHQTLEKESTISDLERQSVAAAERVKMYCISNADSSLLSSPTADINAQFFKAIANVLAKKELIMDLDQSSLLCRQLVEICDTHLETAFDRLLSWIRSFLALFSNINVVENYSEMLREAFSALEKHSNIKFCLLCDEISMQRKLALQKTSDLSNIQDEIDLWQRLGMSFAASMNLVSNAVRNLVPLFSKHPPITSQNGLVSCFGEYLHLCRMQQLISRIPNTQELVFKIKKQQDLVLDLFVEGYQGLKINPSQLLRAMSRELENFKIKTDLGLLLKEILDPVLAFKPFTLDEFIDTLNILRDLSLAVAPLDENKALEIEQLEQNCIGKIVEMQSCHELEYCKLNEAKYLNGGYTELRRSISMIQSLLVRDHVIRQLNLIVLEYFKNLPQYSKAKQMLE